MTEKSEEVRRDILNINEAADLLGVSVKTFNKVLHSENMPARKIGREWKFSRQALIDWVGSGRSRQFYREGSAAESENGLRSAEEHENVRGITPARGEKSASRPGSERTPLDRPRGRRTAGWAIELD
jgi:excisionase family DNA binding protein